MCGSALKSCAQSTGLRLILRWLDVLKSQICAEKLLIPSAVLPLMPTFFVIILLLSGVSIKCCFGVIRSLRPMFLYHHFVPKSPILAVN